jgi:hypothetical protein
MTTPDPNQLEPINPSQELARIIAFKSEIYEAKMIALIKEHRPESLENEKVRFMRMMADYGNFLIDDLVNEIKNKYPG